MPTIPGADAGPVELPPTTGPALSGDGFNRNPSPAYTWLREHAPAYKLQLSPTTWTWLLTRYDDVRAGLQDPRFSKRPDAASPQWHGLPMGLPADLRESLLAQMSNEDGETHMRLRRACAAAFSPGRQRALNTQVDTLAGTLIDRVHGQRTADLVADFAYPLSIIAIADLIGIPPQLQERLSQSARVIAEGGVPFEETLAATDELEAVCSEVLELHSQHPGVGLAADLLEQIAEGTLSHDEALANLFVMVVAGHETTTSAIASAILALLTHPQEMAHAQADSSYLTAVIEEVLRLHAPIQNATWRFVSEPMTVAGQAMEPGDPVLLSLLAANRDPDVFPDPDQFRPGRPGRHLAFGGGPHVCIGAAMARSHAATAVRVVLDHLPDLQLAVPEDELEWWPNGITRGLMRLPVLPTGQS